MDLEHFDSDSTYYSYYENIKQPKERKTRNRTVSKLTDSKFLDKVHEKVLLHFEGKKLIGRVDAVNYDKQISKMKLKNPRDQCFAKNIRLSLLKIYRSVKQFEKSYSSCNVTPELDPTENNSIVEDIKLLNVNNEDVKQILLPTTSVNEDENSSFPLEILTNDNFISLLPNNTYCPMNNFPLVEMDSITQAQCVKDGDAKIESNNFDINVSKNSDVFLNTFSSLNSIDEILNVRHIAEPSSSKLCTTKYTPNVSEEQEQWKNSINCTFTSNTEYELRSNDDIEPSCQSIPNATNSEECNILEQILKVTSKWSKKYNTDITTISETANFIFDNHYVNGANLNVIAVTDLGNNLSKSNCWEKIEEDFKNGQCVVENIHHNLDQIFENLHIDACDNSSIIQQTSTFDKGDFHNFNDEDSGKLNVKDLLNTNKDRLEQISVKFKIYLNSNSNEEVTKAEDKDDEFQIMNWKQLLD